MINPCCLGFGSGNGQVINLSMVKINTKLLSAGQYYYCSNIGNFIRQVTSLLTPVVHRHNGRFVHMMVKSYVNFLIEVEHSHGPQKAMAFAKEFANVVKRRAMRLDCTFNYPVSIGTNESMIPRKLKRFSRFINSSSPTLRGVAITIANLYRVILLDPEVHYNDVLDGYKGETGETISKLHDYVEHVFSPTLNCDNLWINDGEKFTRQGSVRLMSSSPNGKVSAVSAHHCARDLAQPSSVSELNAVYCLYRAFGREASALELTFLIDDNSNVKVEGHRRTRKLLGTTALSKRPVSLLTKPDKTVPLGIYSFIPDKGGKTRGITLANYFIQDSLKPLHDKLMEALSKIPFDYTYRQHLVSQTLSNKYKEGKQAFCFDMKGATDRFPRTLQKKLVHAIYGDAISEAWEILMLLPLRHANNLLRFSTGQPMGLLSSFCVFSLTHHALIQFCFREHNVPPDYMILGDDIVIFEENVGKTYVSMLGSLGVEVSFQKSMLSREGNYSAEFCKKLCHNGKDITGLGSGLITTNRFDPVGLTATIDLLIAWNQGEKSQCYRAFDYSLRYLGKLLPKHLILISLFYLCFWDATPEVFRSFLREKLCLSDEDMMEFKDAYDARLWNKRFNRLYSSEARIERYYGMISAIGSEIPSGNLHSYVHIVQLELDQFLEEMSDFFPFVPYSVEFINKQFERIDLREKLLLSLLKFKHKNVTESPEAYRRETVARFKEFANFVYSYAKRKHGSKITIHEANITPFWRRLLAE